MYNIKRRVDLTDFGDDEAFAIRLPDDNTAVITRSDNKIRVEMFGPKDADMEARTAVLDYQLRKKPFMLAKKED